MHNDWQKKYVLKHPLINVYNQMKQRCYNSNSQFYARYGGRGIEVCNSWLGKDGYKNFVKDMGTRPVGLTLNRINNDGNYEPSNCEWATQQMQILNRGKFSNNKSGVTGVYFSKWAKKRQWRAELEINGKKISIGSFEFFEDAVKARKSAEIEYHKPLLEGVNI